MRTLVHLSDLHFGRVDERLIEPLVARVLELGPDLVVVSGDLTQRARPREFRSARAFLDRLPFARLVVPGNHDIPLYNGFQRFLQPLDKFHRFIEADANPCFIDSEVAVVGVNTARSLTFKGGRINARQLDLVRARLDGVGAAVTKIVVTHHPFDLPEDWDRRARSVGRAALALERLAGCGVDLLLAGHFHRSSAEVTAEAVTVGGASALLVQAGTATSTRGRGESNAFNVLRIAPGHAAIERYAWDERRGAFEPCQSRAFTDTATGWGAVEPPGSGG
jgi:3',5'-cyclic AMP phosphodiesterase CpdA